MTSIPTHTSCPQDYGSIAVNNGANNNNNNSISTTPTRASIRLHSTLDSVAFRSSPTPTTPPSFSPMSGAENHTNGHERQFTPLIRMLSSPTPQNVGNANTEHNSTSLPSGGRHYSSLDTPLLLDDSDKKITGKATAASEGVQRSQQSESEYTATNYCDDISYALHLAHVHKNALFLTTTNYTTNQTIKVSYITLYMH